jgi:DNA invertase Pin-like site-specific DNA recombinase
MITDSGREERTTRRVALYARVSTLNHGQDPEVQLRELRQFCQRRFEIAVEYVDKGISGSRERRPSLDKLMTACRKRLVDAVVVYRYDRFARSLRQLVLALEEFRALGIDFISLHEGVDTSTPNGRLIFGIFASIAEFERELIRDRVRSGLAAARAKGKRIGRPKVAVDALRIASLRCQGARGPRSRPTPGSAKARLKEQWLGCPIPLLEPPPKCLIYRTPRRSILTAQWLWAARAPRHPYLSAFVRTQGSYRMIHP